MEISTRLFQLSREVEFPAIQMAANRLRLIEEGDFHFVERFQLKRIICEPKADNAPPNRLLQRRISAHFNARREIIGTKQGLQAQSLRHRARDR